MLSSTGEVVYVGKSKRVRTRLLSYFRCAYPAEKGARILREAEVIDWDYTPTPVWGQPAKDALSGKQFPPPSRLR